MVIYSVHNQIFLLASRLPSSPSRLRAFAEAPPRFQKGLTRRRGDAKQPRNTPSGGRAQCSQGPPRERESQLKKTVVQKSRNPSSQVLVQHSLAIFAPRSFAPPPCSEVGFFANLAGPSWCSKKIADAKFGTFDFASACYLCTCDFRHPDLCITPLLASGELRGLDSTSRCWQP
jgi:hypothetical protein